MTAVDLLVLSLGPSTRPSKVPPESLQQNGLALHVRPAEVSSLEPEGPTLNRVLETSDGEFFAVLLPGAELLPGALSAIVATMIANPALGAVAAGGFPLKPDEAVDRATVVRAARLHAKRIERHPSTAYLSAFGESHFGLFVFRRAALEQVGGFHSRTEHEASVEIALAIGGFSEVAISADLGCSLVRENGLRARLHRFLQVFRRVRRRPTRSGDATNLRRDRHAPGVVADAVIHAIGLDVAVLRAMELVQTLRSRIGWRIIVPIRERFYDTLLTRFADWPIGRGVAQASVAGPPRIAYYLWRFPVASETFIRRELEALRQSGVDVRVIADGAHYGGALANHDDDAVPVQYLFPIDARALRRDLFRFALRRPLRTLNLLAYVVCRTYGPLKTIQEDVSIFLKAVKLAAVLEDEQVRHVHAPWGDTNAFVAMVAARWVDATFSLQLRAHDLHRATSAFLLEEKIRNARFVVTNTQYNRRHIESIVGPRQSAKVHQIYNGLPVQDFKPSHAQQRTDGPVRVLSVARLIEPKGLVYLFEACARLRSRGHRFVCEVVGGPELPLYINDYLQIRATHKRLGLDGCVELVGALAFADVRKRYENADVFALPCVKGRDGSNDIIPNAILEAMASGLPVVATDITAMSELVSDGESGFLVPPRDVDALTARLAELIESPYLRARMGSYGRRRAEERFDINRNVRSYVALFESP
jgi:glycosyltransferase involved in cell wall biosynthesis